MSIKDGLNVLLEKDQFGIIPSNIEEHIPYVAFELTDEQANKLNNFIGLKPVIYTIDGNNIFDSFNKDKTKKSKIVFVMFVRSQK